MTAPQLTGKVAVITGATSGIGLAVAKERRQLGMRLVLTGRTEQRIQSICAELEAVGFAADVTDAAVPARLLETLRRLRTLPDLPDRRC